MKLSVRKECLCYIFTILSILVIAMFIRSTLWNYLEHLPYTFTISFKTPIDITPGQLQFKYGSGPPNVVPQGDSITPTQNGANWTVKLTNAIPSQTGTAWYLYITTAEHKDISNLKKLFYKTSGDLTQVKPLGDSGIVVPFTYDDIKEDGSATLILDNAPQ